MGRFVFECECKSTRFLLMKNGHVECWDCEKEAETVKAQFDGQEQLSLVPLAHKE